MLNRWDIFTLLGLFMLLFSIVPSFCVARLFLFVDGLLLLILMLNLDTYLNNRFKK